MTSDPIERGPGRTIPIDIVPSDPAWPVRYGEEEARLRGALGPVAIRIDHIGSTAVPGLAAKPIIDIQVSVAALRPRAPYRDPLLSLGYRHRPDGEPEHEFFLRDAGGARAVHVHVCQAGGAWERRHIAFRDALRADAGLRQRYEVLKRDLAGRFPLDIDSYVEGKGALIRTAERTGRRPGDGWP